MNSNAKALFVATALLSATFFYVNCGSPDGPVFEKTQSTIIGNPNNEVLLRTNFETLATGSDPAEWIDTGADNSMMEDDALFKIIASSDGVNSLGTQSNLTNIHSHALISVAPANYRYEGMMRIEGDPNAGVGVTFYSDYPSSDSYYRFRRYGAEPDFRFSPHPDPGASGCEGMGTGVTPAVDQWYSFKIEVRSLAGMTEFKAKVWNSTSPEPPAFQIACQDNASVRRPRGTVGVWSMAGGTKLWRSLRVTSF